MDVLIDSARYPIVCLISRTRRLKVTRFILFAILAGLCCGKAVAQPNMLAIPSELSFDEVLVDGSKTKSFALVNQGTSAIRINRIFISPSTHFTQVSAQIDTISPGEVEEISVRYSPNIEGKHTATLTVDARFGTDPKVELNGEGVTRQAISVSTEALSFRATQDASSDTLWKFFTIENVGTWSDAPLLEFSLTLDDTTHFKTNPKPRRQIKIPAGDKELVEVMYTPRTPGDHSTLLTINHDGQGENKGETLEITLSGMYDVTRQAISVSTEALSFGSVQDASSDTLRKVFTIENVGTWSDAPLLEFSLTLDDTTHFKTNPKPRKQLRLPAGDKELVEVMYAPTEPGDHSTLLTINHDGQGENKGETLEIPLSGEFKADRKAISVSAEALSFGSTQKVSSDTLRKVLTVENIGTWSKDSPLEWSLSLDGSNTDQFQINPPLRKQIFTPTGGKELVEVVYAPTEPGNHSALLTINHDGEGEKTLEIPLSGEFDVTGRAISVSAEALSFGPTQKVSSDTLRKVFTIENIGTWSEESPLELSFSLGGSNANQFQTNPRTEASISIPAGGKELVEVVYAPTTPGNHSASLTIDHNGQGEPLEIPLSGEFDVTGRAISVSAEALSFGSAQIASKDPLRKVFTVENIGTWSEDLPLVLSLSLGGSNANQFQTNPRTEASISIPAGGKELVEVVYAPTTPGNHSASLTIDHNGQGETQEIALSGIGFETPKVGRLTPSKIDIGKVRIGASKRSQANSILSASDSLRIMDISTSSPVFVVEVDKELLGEFLPKGQSVSYRVLFSPVERGEEEETLFISTNDPDDFVREISLSGEGFAAEMALAGEVDKLDFGLIFVGEEKTLQDITLHNRSGTEDLEVTVTTSAAEYILVNSSTVTIPPGGSDAVEVKFRPSSLGEKTGLLTIKAENDPDSSLVKVDLLGTGIGAEILVSPDRVDFQDVSVNGTAVFPLTIFNNGSTSLNFTLDPVAVPFSIEPILGSISAQSSQTVNVTFSPVSSDSFSDILLTNSNSWDRKEALSVSISGRGVRSPLSLSSTSVDFGSMRSRIDTAANEVTIINTGNIPVKISEIAIENTRFGLVGVAPSNSAPLSLNTEESSILRFSYKPLSTGIDTGKVKIISSDPVKPIYEVELRGRSVAPDVVTREDTVQFGAVRRSSPDEKTLSITVENIGDSRAQIDRIEIGNDAFSVSPNSAFALNARGTREISITFDPEMDGVHNALLNLYGDMDEELGEDVLSVFVSGFGISSTISVIPDSLDLGSVSPPNSLSGKLFLQNTGNYPLSISTADFPTEGAFFSVTSPLFPISLESGERSEIEVEFKPLEAGDFRSILAIISDDPDLGKVEIPIKGGGSKTELSLPRSLSFGEIAVGKSSESALLNVTSKVTSTVKISVEPSSDAQFVWTEEAFSILPEESKQIPVVFTPSSKGLKETTLMLRAEDGSPFPVTLQGEGIQQEISALGSVKFPRPVRVSERDTIGVEITNSGTAPLRINEVDIDLPFRALLKSSIEIAPRGGVETINIEFTPTDSVTYKENLVIKSDDPVNPEISMSIEGQGVGPFMTVLSEDDFNFGQVLRKGLEEQNSGKGKTITLELGNVGQDTLFIEEVFIEDETGPFSVKQLSVDIAPGRSEFLEISFLPSEDGEQTTSIIVKTNRPDDEQRIRVSGTGISPKIVVDPVVKFGSVKINPTGSEANDDIKTFFISNETGSEALEIRVLRVGVDDPLQFHIEEPVPTSTAPVIIPKGDVQEVTLRFVPTMDPKELRNRKTGITLTDTLSISSNDVDRKTVKIVLEGEGTVSDLVIPDSLSFKRVKVDTSLVKPLVITNNGEVATLHASFENDRDHQFALEGSNPFNVEGGESSINIRFTPKSRNDNEIITAELVLTDTSTQRPDIVALKGFGTQSSMKILNSEGRSIDLVDFGRFRTNKLGGPRQTVTIDNSGNDVLNASLRSSDNQFVLSSQDIIVDPDEKVDVTMTFNPKIPDVTTASLVIVAPQDIRSEVTVGLVGEGTEPAFTVENVDLEPQPVVFDGQASGTLTIGNVRGTDTLEVSDITFHQFSDEFRVDKKDLSILPGKSASVNISLTANNPALLDLNTVLLDIPHESAADPNSMETKTIQVKFAVADTQFPTIYFNADTLSPPKANTGKSIIVKLEEETGILKPEETALLWRLGGQNSFSEVLFELTDQNEEGTDKRGKAEIPVPSAATGSRGIEYYFKTADSYDNGTIRDRNGLKRFDSEIVPYQMTVKVDELSAEVALYGDSEVKKAYQMVSVPLNLDRKDINLVLEKVLNKPVTKAKPKEWRLFGWNTATNKREEFKPNKPFFGNFSPGNAFWLIVESSGLRMAVGKGESVETRQPFTKSLKSGWNMVGTPFNFPIPWGNVKIGNSTAQEVGVHFFEYSKEYDKKPEKKKGAWSESLYGQKDGLEPWKGYAVWAPRSNLTLSVLPAESVQRSAKIASLLPEWSLRLVVETEDAIDGNNVLGVQTGAREGWDIFDQVEPPVMGEDLSAYFVPEGEDDTGDKLTADFRGSIGDGAMWDFSVERNTGEEKLELWCEGIDSLPSWFRVELVDLHAYGSIDLRNRNGYRFKGKKPIHCFKIIVGTEEYLEEMLSQITPEISALAPNYPNPFNPSTIIPYQVAREGVVEIGIYNVAGQQIRQLFRERQTPGYYKVDWDGRDGKGHLAGSGVYFYHLRTGDRIQTRKLLLLR